NCVAFGSGGGSALTGMGSRVAPGAVRSPAMTSVTGVVAGDVGGTCTDCGSFRDGSISVAKVATTPDQSDGVLEGVRRLVSRSMAAAPLHGTTAATNALLERRGADTVLVTDPGLEDVLEIDPQARP